HHIGKAAKVGGSRHRAINCKRLAALMRVKTVDHPSAQDRIYGLVGIRQERASATERQVVGAGNMNDVCCIAVAKGVVGLDPESGKPLGSILLVLRCLSVLIAHALAPGVVSEQIKACAKLVLIRGLQGVIAAVCVGGFVGGIAGEVGERDVKLWVRS